MHWSYKVHAAALGGLSVLSVATAALVALPGRIPLPGGPSAPMVLVALGFPLLLVAVVRAVFTRGDRRMQWLAFRCLPVVLQGALVLLAGAGIVLSALGTGGRQDAEVRDGLYYVFDTSPTARGEVEVSRDEYEAVRESEWIGVGAGAGTLYAAVTALVLAVGELRREDNPHPT